MKAVAFAVLLAGVLGQAAWTRQPFGDNEFYATLPTKPKLTRDDVVDDPADWVARVREWEAQTDEVFVTASAFTARPGTKMDQAFFTEIIKQSIEAMEDESSVATVLTETSKKIDGFNARRVHYSVGEGKDALYIQATFVMMPGKIVVLEAISFVSEGTPAVSAQKIADSFRAKLS